MITLNTTSRWLVYFIGSMVFLSYYLSRRPNRRGYLATLRIISFPAAGAAFLFLIVTAIRSSHLLDSYFYHDPISGWKIFWIVFDWLTVLLFLYFFKICWLGFIKYNKISLLASWYINEHFSLLKKQKYDEASQCLQKAAEICPDSVHIWCQLAISHELFLEKSDLCDVYLSKAKEVLDSSEPSTDREKAILEHYTGKILQHRGNLQQYLEHMKKAYDLDPTPYRKGEYEKAVEMINTTACDSDESEELA
jgi:tetratricopeptide (TPR) repeat protein